MRPFGIVIPLGGKKPAIDHYCIYAVALLRSLKEQNPGFSHPVVIASDSTLKKAHRSKLKAVYKDIEFHYRNEEEYTRYNKGNPKYLSLEAFNPALQFKKVLLLDTDLICRGSIDGLVTKHNDGIYMWREPVRKCWNSGIVVINKRFLAASWYKRLVRAKHDGRFGNDQAIMNMVFDGIVKPLEPNVQRFAGKDAHHGYCVFLHFIYKYFNVPDQINPRCMEAIEHHLGGDSVGYWDEHYKGKVPSIFENPNAQVLNFRSDIEDDGEEFVE